MVAGKVEEKLFANGLIRTIADAKTKTIEIRGITETTLQAFINLLGESKFKVFKIGNAYWPSPNLINKRYTEIAEFMAKVLTNGHIISTGEIGFPPKGQIDLLTDKNGETHAMVIFRIPTNSIHKDWGLTGAVSQAVMYTLRLMDVSLSQKISKVEKELKPILDQDTAQLVEQYLFD